MKKKIITLRDSHKHYTYDQDKVCSPEETVARFKERLKAAELDVLKEVKRIDTGRLDIPVFFSVCGKDAREIIGNKKQMGKGSTPEQSRASACMELAERFSFFSFIKDEKNFLSATYNEVIAEGYPVLPLEKWLQSVHDESTRPETLAALVGDIPIQWVWARNLSTGSETLMPFSWFYAINEFNGPSAGNTMEEAVLQGLSEIVERHVCAVVTYDEVKTPAIDLDQLTDPVSRELVAKFRHHGIEVFANDFTLDTGIPTVAALAMDPATFPATSEIVYTAGTTPNPEKSLIRALTEVAQLAGDFESKANYVASGLPKPLAMSEVTHLTAPGCQTTTGAMSNLEDSNFKVEVENCVASLAQLGMEVFVVDVRHPELKIPACYTIVPGCHFRERSRISHVGLFVAKLVSERIVDPQEQERQLRRMEEVLPEAYYLQFYQAKNLLNQGLFEQAVPHLEKALTLQPEEEDIPYIYSFLGDCLKNLGHYHEAIAAIEKGRRYDDERPDLHNILGVCYFKLERFAEAISCFQRAVELHPSSAIDYANLGVNHRRLGNNEEAVRYFELALDLDPTIDFARQQLLEIIEEK
ncbi:MAG: YcaO-like family protein [Thermodesulfobacteriota bacterium]